METIKPPSSIRLYRGEPTFFLAGSIEMGTAANWQPQIEQYLQYEYPDSGVILNPRRVNWDASWEQEISNPVFKQQVEWELEALEKSDVVGMYFDPDTKSPITLLEFGLYARSGKLVTCCPRGFWRRGNIDVVCRRYGVDVVYDLKELSLAMATLYDSVK